MLFSCADPSNQKKSDTTTPSEEQVTPSDKKIKIGLSMDSLRVERWQKDRDIFIAEAENWGLKLLSNLLMGMNGKQNEQAENMITQGVDVLVVIPKDSVASSQIVKASTCGGD